MIPNFSAGLKKARKKAGYKTQQALADGINKSLETIRNWEQGQNKPSLDDFISLCITLKCDADYLLNNLDERTHDIDYICKYTGLSADAVEYLHDINTNSMEEEKRTTDFINRVLTNPISPGRGLIETTLFSWLEQYVNCDSVEAWDMVEKKTVSAPGAKLTTGIVEALPHFGDLYKEFLMNRIRDILEEYRKEAR